MGIPSLVSCGGVQPNSEQPEVLLEEIYLSSGDANWTPEQNRYLQESLVNITGKYLEAVLATNSVFFNIVNFFLIWYINRHGSM